jgi:carboxypeptidase C (cathepsin A)
LNRSGFSYSKKIPRSAYEAAKDLLAGLKIFFSLNGFDQYKNKDFYIFGESYGGKYTLALGTEIMNDPLKTIPNLKGLGIGNAWISPVNNLLIKQEYQQKSYGKVGYDLGLTNYYNYIRISK